MKSLFVGNLSTNASESAIRAIFERYGTVEYVGIVTDRVTGEPRGFAFVEMIGDAEGNRAMAELDGQEIDGETLRVTEARPSAVHGLRQHSGQSEG